MNKNTSSLTSTAAVSAHSQEPVMFAQSDVRTLVDALPAAVLTEFRLLNAQYDILCEADEKTRYGVPVLTQMLDALSEKFSMLFAGVLAGMPEAISDEVPTADGEYLLQERLEHILRRL
jgi:hypothetical protein